MSQLFVDEVFKLKLFEWQSLPLLMLTTSLLIENGKLFQQWQ